MAEKRRLPDPEEMLRAKKRRKSLLDICEQLKGIDLFLLLESSAAIPNIPEDHCIAWLVLKYGAQAVFSAASLHSTVPSTLTKHRRLLVIEKLCGGVVSSEVATNILSVAEQDCPSLLDTCRPHQASVNVLTPPVGDCLECGQSLVAYHSCHGRLYTVEGVKEVEKETMRCMECKLFYNYSQYGNKREVSYTALLRQLSNNRNNFCLFLSERLSVLCSSKKCCGGDRHSFLGKEIAGATVYFSVCHVCETERLLRQCDI